MGEFFVVIYSMVFLFRSAHVVTLATPSRGAGASRLRGRQSWVIAIREKTGQCIDPLCHSEERSDVGIRSPYVGTRFRTL